MATGFDMQISPSRHGTTRRVPATRPAYPCGSREIYFPDSNNHSRFVPLCHASCLCVTLRASVSRFVPLRHASCLCVTLRASVSRFEPLRHASCRGTRLTGTLPLHCGEQHSYQSLPKGSDMHRLSLVVPAPESKALVLE